MKLYYKFILNAFYTLFMAVLTYTMISMTIDKFRIDPSAAIPMLLGVVFFGFMTYLFGKTVWMSYKGIPVYEFSDEGLIIRDAIKKTVVIPYESITSIRQRGSTINVVYRVGDVERTCYLTFILVDADREDIVDLLNEFELRLNEMGGAGAPE